MIDTSVSYFICGTPSNKGGLEFVFIQCARPELSGKWGKLIGQVVDEGSTIDRNGREPTGFALMPIKLDGHSDDVLFIDYKRISPYDDRSNRGAYLAVGCILDSSLDVPDYRHLVSRVGAARAYCDERIYSDRGSFRGVDSAWSLRDIVGNADTNVRWNTVLRQHPDFYDERFLESVVSLVPGVSSVSAVWRFRDAQHLLDVADDSGSGEFDGGVLGRGAQRNRKRAIGAVYDVDCHEVGFLQTEEFRLLLVGLVGVVLGLVVGVSGALLVAGL